MKQKKESVADLFGDSPPPIGEKGAPAALKAIEAHELQCRNEKDEAHKEWKEAQDLVAEGDDVSESKERRLHFRYIEALEHWDDATKKLALFDKGVSAERREGEKIPVAECKEIFAQYELSLRLAMEAYIIKIAQDAALCESAEGFHLAHAEAIRACREGAIASARREGVLPGWLT